jgi:electron transport complex protein RnfE
MEKNSKLSILTKGLIKENPVLVLLLGTCPFLATSTSAINGAGMVLSTTAVLICANIVISLLKNVIPDRVRIPCYIVVIAGFVTVVQFLLQAYLPSLNASLGLYIPLIVVNCIILGRAEMFANKNSVVDSALDGIGMGLGFTLALAVMGAIRELLGAGTILGFEVTTNLITPMSIFVLAPGGFFVFGLLTAIVNRITGGKLNREFSCSGCPGEEACKALSDDAAAETKAAPKADASVKTNSEEKTNAAPAAGKNAEADTKKTEVQEGGNK